MTTKRRSLGLGEAIYEESKENISDFVAHRFEDVAISYITEQNLKGHLFGYFEPIRNYKADNSKSGRSIEFGGLSKGIGKKNDHLLVIECKFRTKIFPREDFERLKESLSVFEEYKNRILSFLKVSF